MIQRRLTCTKHVFLLWILWVQQFKCISPNSMVLDIFNSLLSLALSRALCSKLPIYKLFQYTGVVYLSVVLLQVHATAPAKGTNRIKNIKYTGPKFYPNSGNWLKFSGNMNYLEIF